MRPTIINIGKLCARSGRGFAIFASAFLAEGRVAILQWIKARAELADLDVQERKDKLKYQRAKNLLEVLREAEKIKSPDLRELTKSVITGARTDSTEIHQLSRPAGRSSNS